jgi:hypothetical protein
MALVHRDPTTTLHHRRNRRASHIRDHTAHRHHLRQGCGRKVTRGRDNAAPPVCQQLELKGIAKQRCTHRVLRHGAPSMCQRAPTRTRHRSPATGRRKPPPKLRWLTSHRMGDSTHGRHLQNHKAHRYRRKQHPPPPMARQRGSIPSHDGPLVGSTSPPWPPLRNHGAR